MLSHSLQIASSISDSKLWWISQINKLDLIFFLPINIKIIESVKDEDDNRDRVNENYPHCNFCGDARDVEKSDSNYRCELCKHDIDENGDCKTMNCPNCSESENDDIDEWRTELRGSSGNYGHIDPTPLTPSPSTYSPPKCNECDSLNMKVRAGRMECQNCGNYQA